MKIIGKNSVSTALRWLFLFLAVVTTLLFAYEMLGFGIAYYNLNSGNSLWAETFYAGYSIDWGGQVITHPKEMFFRFLLPFSQQQLVTGSFTVTTFVYQVIGGLFLPAFCYFGYRIFRNISSDRLFTLDMICWMKRFSLLNIIFFMLVNLCYMVFVGKFSGKMLFDASLYLMMGVMVYFVALFFKKGYDLQNEQDLTI